jgi:uncharacterized membrane protein
VKAAFGAAAVLFGLSAIVIWRAPIDGDIVELSGYGHMVLNGQLPYRDFYLEYPPGSIPLFTLPALGEFVTWFRVEAVIAWLFVLAFVAMLLEELHPRRRYNPLLLGFVAVVPLVLGPFSLMRFDGWPTACVLAALLLLLRRHPNWAMAALAVGTLIKAWPLGLVPLFVVAGVRLRGLVVFAGVVLAGLLPFMILAPVGSYNAFRSQLDRHLEFESISASVLFAVHAHVHTYFETGSRSVSGSLADHLATVQSLVQVAVFLLAAWLYARSRRRPEDLVLALSLGVASASVLGKVLSPQYLLWLAPFAVLVDSSLVLACFACACVATNALMAQPVSELADQRTSSVVILAIRNAFLLAMTVAIARRAAARLPADQRTRTGGERTYRSPSSLVT